MRSIKTTVTAAALVTAGFVLTAPAAHADTDPQAKHDCRSAISMAQKARHDYNAAVEDLKEQVAAGGHPGTAEEDNVTDLMNKAKAAVWDAVQSCKGEEDRDHHHHRRHPHGAMHTGQGSTSQGVSGAELAGGVGILGAAGAGAVALRRRRAGGES